MTSDDALIQVRGLVNRFGSQTVHDGLDLDIRRGEILGVVGGSGTGKSVLLRSIVGLRRPNEGSVSVFGENLLELSAERRSQVERRFGVLFQRGALFTSLNLQENVALPLIEHAGLERRDAEHLARLKLALAGLPADAACKYPDELSGGMVKRAALARALALDPEVLFLDEPTAGLDPIGAAAFDQLILTLRDALGLSVFLVTHDLDTLYTICDRVAVLSRKRVLVADRLEVVEATDDAWVRDYFHGPRGRAAHRPPTCWRTEMETRAHHVMIGLFTVLAVGGALLFALWLGKSSMDREYNYYEISFNRAVSGLSNGSSVEYSGIKVGDVEALWLEPDDPRKVRARIRVYAGTPIKQDTRARLALANITGSMIIQLHSGTPQSPPLEGKRGEPPLIIADPSPLSALLENGEDLMTNINNLLRSANLMLSEDNAERIGRTLANLEQATSVLAEQRDDLSQALTQLSQLGQQTNTALAEITRLTQNANGLIDDEGRQLLSSAGESMAALERATSRLDELLSSNQGALNNGLQGFSDLGPAINELRGTLGALRRVTQRLEDNPSGFLLGREKIQEFTP